MSTKIGLLQTKILLILKIRPTHGYHLMKELKGDGELTSPGTIYPALNALLKMGLVDYTEKNSSAAKRKIYRLTEKGAAQLAKTEKMFFESIIHNMNEDIVKYSIDWFNKYLDIQEGSNIIYSCADSVELYNVLLKGVGDSGKLYVVPRIDIDGIPEGVNIITENDIDNLKDIDYAIFFDGIPPLVPAAVNLENLCTKLNKVLDKNGTFVFSILDSNNIVLKTLTSTLMPINIQQAHKKEDIEIIISKYFYFETIYNDNLINYICRIFQN